MPHTAIPEPDKSSRLPAFLEPGDEVTVYFPSLPALAEIHVGKDGPITRPYATLGGGRRVTGPPIDGVALRTFLGKGQA